jgi:predicted metal-dependent hydrolase
MAMAEDVVHWGTTEISFRYEFSRRKTLSIHVYPDLSVLVKAPLGTAPETLRTFVARRGGWIKKSWRDFEQYLPKQPSRRYINGETHRYLGRQYRLKAIQGETEGVKCLRGYLWITTKGEPTPEKIKKLLDGWFRFHAKIVFENRLTACLQRAGKESIPQPALSIRKMVSRWGSLSTAGRITLNLMLISVPKECIDYVILHELCHLKIKHHGPRFWILLERLMPDYMERRKKLNLYAE